MSYLWIALFIPLLFEDLAKGENVQLIRQDKIFSLYLGVPNGHNFPEESFVLYSYINHFHDPEIVHQFHEAYEEGYLPVNGIYTSNDERTEKLTLLLFKLLYSAKDFETFYKTAKWAKKDLHPVQFTIPFTLAVLHRNDCHRLIIPPLYEILPNFFTPAEIMHEAFVAKMLGIKEGKFPYNSTGYENNYHKNKFGGPLSPDAAGHSEHKVSYFREDIGLNNWFTLNLLRYPNWMDPEKLKGMDWFKRGETMYYSFQQLFAIYTLQRLANKLTYTQKLEWEKPIRVGYYPKVSYVNGRQLFYRPDNMAPLKYNIGPVKRAQMKESRLYDVVHSEKVWNTENETLITLDAIDGTDLLSRMIFGMPNVPNSKFFGNYFGEAIKALGYVPHISSEHELAGNAMSISFTTLRDPVFYQFLNRLLNIFQEHKKSLPCYTSKELDFHGVHVKDFDVDKLITYFELFDYELTNGVPMKHQEDYNEYSYYGRQPRLNHKPYKFKVTIKSEIEKEAMVRVFIGPKYDAENRLLSLEQSRLAFVEIDRFPVKLTVGDNLFERNSKESPTFSHEPESFKNLIKKISKALKNSEHYHIEEDIYRSIPERFQLPLGKKHGQHFVISVVVTPYEPAYIGEHFSAPFGSPKFYDKLPLGYPFDRPIEAGNFHVHNILFKDVLVYHKDESDMNTHSELI